MCLDLATSDLVGRFVLRDFWLLRRPSRVSSQTRRTNKRRTLGFSINMRGVHLDRKMDSPNSASGREIRTLLSNMNHDMPVCLGNIDLHLFIKCC